jgi:DNA (cytosine-5)-methyltransferase 1
MQSVAHAVTGEGFDASEDGTERGTPLVPVMSQEARNGDTFSGCVAFDTTQITSAANYSSPKAGDPCHPLAAGMHAPAIAFDCKAGQHFTAAEDHAPTLRSMNGLQPNGGGQLAALTGAAVRRLTPRECERLQGFPDDYTLVPHRGKPAADGPRYKALGNSWAVPCAAWIGRRIEAVEAIAQLEAA